MGRAFVIVLDSLGIGGAPDAARFGEVGADTLGHIAERVALKLANLSRLGLGAAAEIATGRLPRGLGRPGPGAGFWAAAAEASRGKDTPTGHWEIAGCPVPFDWGYFPSEFPSFPAELVDALMHDGGLPGILGNCAASGTAIIDELGAEHVATGKPIFYTSADSVLQIAAHEEHFGLDRLLALCERARVLCDPYDIGRVIARPFVGSPGSFRRTANRRDYAVPPPADTILDRLQAAGRAVISLGKIGDIFAHRATGTIVKGENNAALMAKSLDLVASAPDGAFGFVNLVDFDTLYGHRRDAAGYAAALVAFDGWLPSLEAALRPGDLVILTADHGCDPTWPGTDHTRECVPVVGFGPDITGGSAGLRTSFADIGETVLAHLGLPPIGSGHAIG
ncbi:MAG TPA: phosphopentomutase [Aliidongia sp.]|uniref:phosphopentomutase n=1 Tax=Aliidongia sp. TaxID=1914230 RepID=UPI002DDD14DA|nr:phosphopentomutase [Aliidongia sp.]HEV2678847.1 phosphopentomutase [Aliidongia sp.]